MHVCKISICNLYLYQCQQIKLSFVKLQSWYKNKPGIKIHEYLDRINDTQKYTSLLLMMKKCSRLAEEN